MKIVLFFPFEGTYLRRDLFSSLLGSSALSKGVYCFFYSSLAVSLYVHVHSLSPGLSASPGIDIQNLVKLLQMGTGTGMKSRGTTCMICNKLHAPFKRNAD